jgi:N-acyl-L-homoserine lactone synthetase
MSVRIRLARTAEDLDAVFRLRHRVFAEEEGIFGLQADGRVVDRFDTYPITGITLAEIDGHAVGTYRITEVTPVGTSTDEWYDFGPHLPSGTRAGAASLLAVEREFRERPGLVFSLLAMLYSWAANRGLTMLTAAVRPSVLPTATNHEWRTVGPQQVSSTHGLPFYPVVLRLEDLPARFVRFFKTHKRPQLFDRFERGFFEPGEPVFATGDQADGAYVVIDGTAEVIGDDGRIVATLTSGDIFGELALINDSARTASVVAVTDLTVMIVERVAFSHAIETEPATAREVIRILAERAANLLEPRA